MEVFFHGYIFNSLLKTHYNPSEEGKMKKLYILAIIFSVLMTSLSFGQNAKIYVGDRTALQSDIPSFVGYVPDAIVVKFESAVAQTFSRSRLAQGKTGNSTIDALNQRFAVRYLKEMFPGAQQKYYAGSTVELAGFFRVKFSSHQKDIESVAAAYQAVSGVIKAEPIGIHSVSVMPNDGSFSDQWHLNQSNDHDIDAPEAWDIEAGNEDIIVSVFDTGVRYFHKDLGGSNASYSDPTNVDGNVWINWAEKNGAAGVDDDGNGFVDDWVGWDFVDDASDPPRYPGWPGEDVNDPDNDPRDFNGHGTHCAGNVAALNNNDFATCSPSGGWGNGTRQPSGNGVKVMACRIGWSADLRGKGRYELGFVRMDFAAEAFYYAADNGAKIVSCSWGSSNSAGLADAINYFLASGGMIFKSAGNDGNETADYMCGRNDIISVAATDQNDCRSDFSSYGTWVDISAPGTAIYSLYHSHDDPEGDYIASIDGTSMASPLAASVAALIWSQNPGWSASQVEQKLYDSADDIDNLSCNSSYAGKLGAGRVNAYNAVAGGTPQPPVAEFVGNPTSGAMPLTVNFTDQSTGSITTWSWDFGDGGTSTAQNPSHTYNAAGTYTVELTVTGPGGSDTETKVDYITVTSGPEPPVAEFVGSPTSGTVPLTVNFTEQSTGDIDSWSWTFGDGGTSTDQNPSHTYNNAGDYTVSLTVTGPGGSDTETKTDYITVSAGGGDFMHINDVTVTKVTVFGRWSYGKVEVQIVDQNGSPVEGATVEGEWIEGASGAETFTTGSDGWGSEQSGYNRNVNQYCFEVTNVSKTDWTYDTDANVENWACSDGTGGLNALPGSSPNAKKIGEIEQELGENVVFSHPNPFNSSTTISFYLQEAGNVTVDIYNVLGKKIATVLDNHVAAGLNSVFWNGTDANGSIVGAGYFFFKVRFPNGESMTQRMLMLK